MSIISKCKGNLNLKCFDLMKQNIFQVQKNGKNRFPFSSEHTKNLVMQSLIKYLRLVRLHKKCEILECSEEKIVIRKNIRLWHGKNACSVVCQMNLVLKSAIFRKDSKYNFERPF